MVVRRVEQEGEEEITQRASIMFHHFNILMEHPKNTNLYILAIVISHAT